MELYVILKNSPLSYQAKELGNRNFEKLSEMIFYLSRKELKNYTSLATTVIKISIINRISTP
jgi:hypothetical protein